LLQEAPKVDMEVRARLSQGALSLAWVLAHDQEERDEGYDQEEAEEA
jgi:hypothetical protein